MKVKMVVDYGTSYYKESGERLTIPEGIVIIDGVRCILVRRSETESGHGYCEKFYYDNFYSTETGKQYNPPKTSNEYGVFHIDVEFKTGNAVKVGNSEWEIWDCESAIKEFTQLYQSHPAEGSLNYIKMEELKANILEYQKKAFPRSVNND